MVISRVGTKLQEVLSDLVDRRLDLTFTLRKPHFGALDWETVGSLLLVQYNQLWDGGAWTVTSILL